MSATVSIAPEPAQPWGERVAEWAGPLVVKEVRAGLKSRAFAVAFGLMLLAGFVVVLVNASMSGTSDEPRGRYAFMGMCVVFAVYGHLLAPFIAFRAMVKEREDETWVLLVLTGLGTGGIVRGKHLSAIAQVGLGAAATAPFMLLSYLLAGVGLANVLLGVWWQLGTAFLLTTAAVGLAAQSESRLERTLGHFIMLGLSLVIGAIGLAVCGALSFNGERVMREGETVGVLMLVPVAMVAVGACVLPAAAAALALDSESRSHPARVRLMWTFGVGVLATAFLVWQLEANVAVGAVGSVIASLLLLCVGFFSISELPGYPHATRDDGFARPGAFRSTVVAFGLLVFVGCVFTVMLLTDEHRTTGLAIAAPAYVALYLSIGVIFARVTPLGRLGHRAATRLGFLVATVLGIAVPTALAIIDGSRPDRGPLWVMNPFFGMIRFIDRSHLEEEAIVLALVASMAAVVALMLLYGADEERSHA